MPRVARSRLRNSSDINRWVPVANASAWRCAASQRARQIVDQQQGQADGQQQASSNPARVTRRSGGMSGEKWESWRAAALRCVRLQFPQHIGAMAEFLKGHRHTEPKAAANKSKPPHSGSGRYPLAPARPKLAGSPLSPPSRSMPQLHRTALFPALLSTLPLAACKREASTEAPAAAATASAAPGKPQLGQPRAGRVRLRRRRHGSRGSRRQLASSPSPMATG